MTSKNPASSKRAVLPRVVDYAKAFRKDWQRLSHSGRHDLKRLKEAMLLLIANDAPLGPEWLDHPLKGDWADHRECHIGGDFLLIYQQEGEQINFVRADTRNCSTNRAFGAPSGLYERWSKNEGGLLGRGCSGGH